MKITEVNHSELKARFNKLTDFNKKIAELYQLFSNYFINAVEILNVLFLVLDDSELSNIKIINNSNTYIINIINLNLSDAVINLIIITSSDSLKKTSIKKIIM